MIAQADLQHFCSSKTFFKTHISLMSLLGDIGKQYNPRCDDAERVYSVCLENFHQRIEYILKITPNTPKSESELIQLIMMGESIHQIWVKQISGLISNENIFSLP